MDLFNIWLPLIGGGILLAIAISAWFSANKVTGVWFGFAGGVCLLLLIALQVHEHVVGERDAVGAATAPPAPTDSPERPWISVGDPIVISPLKFQPFGATITLRFPIRHTGGRNPALNVSFKGELIATTPERSAPHLERDRFVAQLKALPDGLVFGERSLFQGDNMILDQEFLIPMAEIENAATLYAQHDIRNAFLPVFVACIVYKIARGGERHYTCIVGDVYKANPNGLSPMFDITAGDIPANQIQAPQLYAPYVD